MFSLPRDSPRFHLDQMYFQVNMYIHTHTHTHVFLTEGDHIIHIVL